MGGLFGIISKGNCFEDVWFGTDYLSHLGADSAGLALLGDELFEPVYRDIRGSQFKTAFKDVYNKLDELNGFAGMGVISDIEDDRQPIRLDSNIDTFSISTIGLIKNAGELVEEYKKKGSTFKRGVNQTEIVGEIISKEDSIVEGIETVYEKIRGAVSLVLLSENEKTLYATGDIFPTAIGKSKENDGWAVATDTTPFLNLNYDIVDSLNHREIAIINESVIVDRIKTTDKNILCPFLYVYYGFPAYEMFGINSEVVRERCGGFLAEKDSIGPNLVFGVESSGLPHCAGYEKRKLEILKEGIRSVLQKYKNGEVGLDEYEQTVEDLFGQTAPLRRAVIKYMPGWGRSYIPSNQEERDLIADKKQVPNPQLIRDKVLVVVDDSIRRGTQFERYKKDKIDPYGPKEVHGRIGSPVQMFTCFYDPKTKIEDLAAHKAIYILEGKHPEDSSEYRDGYSAEYEAMVGQISKNIGLDSLMYVTLDEMIEAIVGAPGNKGISRENLCTYCWNGTIP